MADEITNHMLLEHMQGMKYELQEQIKGLDAKISGLDAKVGNLDRKVVSLEEKMRSGFEDARLHREALQEDLEETMRVQAKHGAKLARM